MPKNIIFLDVDGVLNFVTCKDRSPGGYTGIADSRVKILAEIVKENDADIILTSTWKRNWMKHLNLKDLQDPDATYLD